MQSVSAPTGLDAARLSLLSGWELPSSAASSICPVRQRGCALGALPQTAHGWELGEPGEQPWAQRQGEALAPRRDGVRRVALLYLGGALHWRGSRIPFALQALSLSDDIAVRAEHHALSQSSVAGKSTWTGAEVFQL